MEKIDNYMYERELREKGITFIAGVDEVGRGPLIGPVVAAAVICPLCNTAILSIALVTIFKDLVLSWALAANYSSALEYVILGMVGLNFIVELAINVVFIPAIIKIIKMKVMKKVMKKRKIYSLFLL